MSDSPFRQRLIPPDEVRRIVARAAALAAVEPADAGAGQALTEAELERRLVDLGIPRDAVQRVISGASGTTAARSDGATQVVREEEVAGMVPPERHEQIADAIAAAMDMPGRVSVVGNKLSWVPGGILLEPAITVHSKNGVTRVHYVETLANRGQQIVGFVTLAGLGGMIAGPMAGVVSAAIARTAGMTAAQGGSIALAVAVVIGLMAALSAIVGFRRLLARRARNRNAFADAAVARIVAAVGAAAVPSETRTRIAAPTGEEEETELESAGDDASEAMVRRR